MVTLTCLRSHVRQTITTLECLDAVLAEAEPGQLDEPALSQAARDLARLEDAVAWIAEGLGVGCDPLAAAR
jgi:hypothetical protein